jgi:hypothetical protein
LLIQGTWFPAFAGEDIDGKASHGCDLVARKKPRQLLVEGLAETSSDLSSNDHHEHSGQVSARQREKMKDLKVRLEAYWDNLNPENFECASKVYFCFENHAKALVVDDMAYVGSANFTEASAHNFEAGVLLTEKTEVDELEAFIKRIRDSSLPMLKAAASKEASPLLKLLDWSFEIVRSIREENGFILSDDQEWIEDPDCGPRESIRISEKLTAFLSECRAAAEVLLKRCGGGQEILNTYVLNEGIELVRYFDDRRYNDSLPKPFDEAAVTMSLTEEMLNQFSPEANVDDVMSHPEYSEQFEACRSARQDELNAAVIEAVDDIIEHIETTVQKLRSSFGPEDVSPKIDNTGINSR